MLFEIFTHSISSENQVSVFLWFVTWLRMCGWLEKNPTFSIKGCIKLGITSCSSQVSLFFIFWNFYNFCSTFQSFHHFKCFFQHKMTLTWTSTHFMYMHFSHIYILGQNAACLSLEYLKKSNNKITLIWFLTKED